MSADCAGVHGAITDIIKVSQLYVKREFTEPASFIVSGTFHFRCVQNPGKMIK